MRSGRAGPKERLERVQRATGARRRQRGADQEDQHFAAAELARNRALATWRRGLPSRRRATAARGGRVCEWRLAAAVADAQGGRSRARGEVTMLRRPGGCRSRAVLFGLGESDQPAPFGEAEYPRAARARGGVARAGSPVRDAPPGRATGSSRRGGAGAGRRRRATGARPMSTLVESRAGRGDGRGARTRWSRRRVARRPRRKGI